MSRRPHSVTAIGVLFIIVGVVSVAYHASEFKTRGSFQYDLVWVLVVRLTALVCGVFMLRGSNWARWVGVGWMAFHVGLSAVHSWSALIVHGALLGIIVYCLFRPPASAYFRGLAVAREK